MPIFATFSATISDDVYVILFKHLESPVRIPLPIKNTETYKGSFAISLTKAKESDRKNQYTRVLLETPWQ